MADNVQYSTTSIGGTIPKIIGHPGHQTASSKGFDNEYEEIVTDKLVVASMIPLLPTWGKDANIYDPKNAWGQYVGDLGKLSVNPGENSGHINVALSTVQPVTTQFNNSYGESSILKAGRMLGDKAAELMMMTGAKNFHELSDRLNKSPGADNILKKLGAKGSELIAQGTDFLAGVSDKLASETGMPIIGGVGNALARAIDSPWSKIAWPQMWKDCTTSSQYQVNTRLYCFNTTNEQEYQNNIQASMAALELFVVARSTDGILYTQPYMVQFEIPGMVYFPMAYVSDMTVIKGGNEGDFAANGRPNVVDITFTVNSCYGIETNVANDEKYPYRPSVKKDLIGMSGGKNLYKKRNLNPDTGSSFTNENDSKTTTFSDSTKLNNVVIKELQDYVEETDNSRKDSTPTTEQQNASAALDQTK